MKNKNGKNNKNIISAENKKGVTVTPKKQSSIVKKQIKTVSIMHFKLLQKTLKGFFEIGEKILQIKETAIYDNWKNFVKDNFPFSYETSCRYIRVYEHFKDKPEYLEGKTIKDAYYEIGIKKSPIPIEYEEDGKIYTAGLEDFNESYDDELATIFNRKTVSGIKLEKYRVEIYGEELWGFREGYGRFPIADLLIPKPIGLPEIEWKDMKKNLCMLFEDYYAKIEMYENNGKIDAPDDTSFGIKMKNKYNR